MEDESIVALYWERSRYAVEETARKYGIMLHGISYRLTGNRQDSEECVNDTYLAAWNGMPTDRPAYLGAYLSTIVRNISISRFRKNSAERRGGGMVAELTDELCRCIPDAAGDVFAEYESGRLRDVLNRFVGSLDAEKRAIFLRRHFFSDSISGIAERVGISEAKVKTTLFRLRAALKKMLGEEGFM